LFDSIEAALDLAKKLKKFLIFIWDSVAATPGHETLVGEIGPDMAAARRAKVIKNKLDQYMGRMAKENACLIFVNQIQDRTDVMFGDKTTTPGGRSIKHWASVRMLFKSVGRIKDDLSKEQIGTKGHMVVKKHKAGVPFREVNFEHYIGQKLDRYTGLFDYMYRHGEVIKTGAGAGTRYHFSDDEKTEFTKDEFVEFYEKRSKDESKKKG
jgi:recombination protein RecA